MSRLGGLVEAKDAEIGELKASNAALVAEVRDLKDEIARLKGLPPRPKFKGRPSGMEQATSKPLGKKGRKRGRGSKVDKLTVTSQVKLKVEAPPGSRFRGYAGSGPEDQRGGGLLSPGAVGGAGRKADRGGVAVWDPGRLRP